jgi:hypothetical protein
LLEALLGCFNMQACMRPLPPDKWRKSPHTACHFPVGTHPQLVVASAIQAIPTRRPASQGLVKKRPAGTHGPLFLGRRCAPARQALASIRRFFVHNKRQRLILRLIFITKAARS